MAEAEEIDNSKRKASTAPDAPKKKRKMDDNNDPSKWVTTLIDPKTLENPKKGWDKIIPKHCILLANQDDKHVYWIDTRNNPSKLGKKTADPRKLVGKPYGSFWEFQGSKFVQIAPPKEEVETTGTTEEQESIISANQDSWDTNLKAQHTQNDDIERMREAGKSGSEVVKELVKGAKNFDKKNVYQQEKYIGKKSKKHIQRFQTVRCTGFSLSRAHFMKKPRKVMDMRPDTLSQLLASGNVSAGARVLIVEDCSGIVVASACEKMGGYGKILHGHCGKEGLQCLHSFIKPEPFVSRTVVNFNLNILPNLHEDLESDSDVDPLSMKKPFVRPSVAEIKKELRLGCDSLILASEFHPLTMVKLLIPVLKAGAPFVVYSQTIEPLIEIHQWGKNEAQEMVFNIRLWDNWYRKHQVLPGRTHPAVHMSATGGYLLSGYKLSDVTVQSEGHKGKPRKPAS